MQDAETVLVIILSVTLTIFLIVAIVLGIAAFRLVKLLQNIALKADGIVTNVENATEVIKKAAGPLAIGKMLMNIANLVSNKGKKKG